MGRHTLQRHRARQWSCAPARTKVHLGRRWVVGVAGGASVLSVAFWGSGPAVAPALPLASAEASTGSTEHPELLPSVGTGLHAATGLGQALNAAVLPAPELLKVVLAKPLPSVTIEVHPAPAAVPALPGYGSPAPVVRPPCPDPVQHPGAYRAWWLKWFPHTTPPVVTPPVVTPPPTSTPEPAPIEEPDPLPAPSSPAQTPPAVEEPAPEPTHEPEPDPQPEPESSSADDSGPAETASPASGEESAPDSEDSSDDSDSPSSRSGDGHEDSSDPSPDSDSGSDDSSDHEDN